MALRFTVHAARRMTLRAISRAEVEATIVAPDETNFGETAIEYFRIVDGRPIGVVVARDTQPPLVITVMLVGEEYR